MHRFITPLCLATVASALLLGSHLYPPGEQVAVRVEALRVTNILPDSRELTTTRRLLSF
jgi:hypothetical protein